MFRNKIKKYGEKYGGDTYGSHKKNVIKKGMDWE